MSERKTFAELFVAHHGHGSDKWEQYFSIYESHLRHFVENDVPISLLEVGVQNGGSLELWRSYLPNKSNIVGIDIDERCRSLELGEGIEIRICDASSKEALLEVVGDDKFHVIIDDGSHLSSDIIATFESLFAHLVPGGVYIAEDIHCSYMPEFGGGFRRPEAAVEYFKNLIDGLNLDHFSPADGQSETFRLHSVNEWISRIAFYDSVVVLEKNHSPKYSAYKRVLSGSNHPVLDQMKILRSLPPLALSKFVLSSTFAPAISEVFIERFRSMADEIAKLQASEGFAELQNKTLEADAARQADELREAGRQLDVLRRKEVALRVSLEDIEARYESAMNQIFETKTQVAAANYLAQSYRTSTSWKITRPMRQVKTIADAAPYLLGRAKLATRHYGGPLQLAQEVSRRIRTRGVLNELRRLVAAANGKGSDIAPMSEIEVAAASNQSRHHLSLILERNRLEILKDAYQRFQPVNSHPRSAVGPKFSIIVPVYNTADHLLRAMADSVRRQSYENWELHLVDDGSTQDHVAETLKQLQSSDQRILAHLGRQNSGISEASNVGLHAATGDYVVLLDHDDLLTFDALSVVGEAIGSWPEADLLYSDECKIDPDGMPLEVFSKPDWSPELLLNYMYIGHLTVYRVNIVREVGGFRKEFDFSQDYDLALRITELTRNIVHIPKVLYGWRAIPESGAAGGKPYARLSNIAALQDAAHRRRWSASAVAAPSCNRLDWDAQRGQNVVSIIIPSDNVLHIEESIETIAAGTSYKNYEILVVTNSGIIATLSGKYEGVDAVKFVPFDKKFNFSEKCNVGALNAVGDILCFFNDDVRTNHSEWLDRIVEMLRIDGVGAVGPKLLYENDTIQHAGMVTGVRRLVGTAFHCLPNYTHIHYNFAQSVRDVSLICGACIAVPASVYREIGGFDQHNAPISHSDVDLCFKIREAGYRCVYTPHASLMHIGHVSIAAEEKAANEIKKEKSNIHLLRRWPKMTSYDPYFPPNMRDILYHDSPEPYQIHPGKIFSGDEAAADILMVSHDLSASGAPRVVLETATVLQRQGHFVVVVAPEDGPMRKEFERIGVTVIIDSLVMRQHDTFFDFAKDFDVILANTAVAWPVVKQMGDIVPVIWYLHEIELLSHLAAIEPQFAEVLQRTEHIWAGSAHSADLVASLGGKAKVLEYGLESLSNYRLTQQDDVNGKMRLSVFGSFERRKGQDLLVQAVQMLPDDLLQNLEVVFFGRTLDEAYRNDVLKQVTLPDVIKFEGELSHQQYISELLSSSMVVVPSRHDTLPLVSLNALSAAIPLLCTKQTGTSAYIENGVSGFIAEDASPKAIAEVLRRALVSNESWNDIGARGEKAFRKYFSIAAFEEKLALALSEVSTKFEGKYHREGREAR